MSKVLELLSRLCGPKSTNLEARSPGPAAPDSLLREEMFAALAQAAKKHKLGVLIINATYLNDNESEQLLRQHIHQKCENLGIDCPDILSMIIAAMILDIPLITQREKMKSLYQQYGGVAKVSKRNIDKLKKRLGAINITQNKYMKESLCEQIEHEEAKLNNYAGRMAVTTNVCPRCKGLSPCRICGSTGKVQVKMNDAIELFKALGIPYSKGRFLTQYWTTILAVASELEVERNNAVRDMNIRLFKEVNSCT